MAVVQGKYLKAIISDKGNLKALKLKTKAGKVTVQLPKALQAIAQTELTPGTTLRVWTDGKQAIQLIPLAPKSKIADMDSNAMAKKSAKKFKKSKKSKPLTVQLCQKKNCCKRGGDRLWEAFETRAKQGKATQQRTLKVQAVGCLGGCKKGPNLRVLPDNVKHYHVQPDEIDKLLARHNAG
ncbi:MAG: (2Fe-2S) ferredoxin domain-containing protein [Cyanobacteria bacterium J06643_4]